MFEVQQKIVGDINQLREINDSSEQRSMSVKVKSGVSGQSHTSDRGKDETRHTDR